MKKIFIDQGHNNSGWNTGAMGNGLKEQDITYSVGKKLEEKLKNLGLETKVSRETKKINLGKDNKSSINTRYKLSNDWGADYFISIHCNSGGGTGTEVLYYKDNSKEYAEIILKNYIEEIKLKNRGIKYRSNIAVIKYTKAKAILIELGFIDNKLDALILKNKQEEIAEAISKGFIDLLNIKDKIKIKETISKRYNKIEEIPAWGKETIKKLIEKNYIAEKDNFDLSEDMIRTFVINDRAKAYK